MPREGLFETVMWLTERDISHGERQRLLGQFSREAGWHPSDSIIDFYSTDDLAAAHLLVEYGLDNAAVITFLRPGRRLESLSSWDLSRLAAIPYNNLVDIQIFPDRNGSRYLHVRKDPLEARLVKCERPDDAWRSGVLDLISNDSPSPNIKPLDVALVDTISFWRRALVADMGGHVNLAAIADTFNSILLLRAREDDLKLRRFVPLQSRTLVDNCLEHVSRQRGVPHNWLIEVAASLRLTNIPRWALDMLANANEVLGRCDRATLVELLSDFYRGRATPFQYDFALISKHALSKIYEHYTSVLGAQEDRQPQLFPVLPVERFRRRHGVVYTPQFIARFFSRFLRENVTPRAFRSIRAVDPACGSGVFLRTLLEMQVESSSVFGEQLQLDVGLRSLVGWDIDPNAAKSAQLSLALLHLVVMDRIPDRLDIQQANALSHYAEHSEQLAESFDAVLTNPPFVRLDDQNDEERQIAIESMAQLAHGRVDKYLAVLKICLDMLKPGGFGLFVLPYTFLMADNASLIRRWMLEHFRIRFVVDLSNARVFGDTGAYVILLGVEKWSGAPQPRQTAVVASCMELVGGVLDDIILGKRRTTPAYTVFDVPQTYFERPQWAILTPPELAVARHLEEFAPLGSIVEAHQGMVSGDDSVFVRHREDLPEGESAVWRPLLRDRDMQPFLVPKRSEYFVFMPFEKGQPLTEESLRTRFPKTWGYLESNREKLSGRPGFRRAQAPWWKPTRARDIEVWNCSKILTPHLAVSSRFCLDEQGKYVVSRSPVLVPRNSEVTIEMLRLLVVMLNTPVIMWQLLRQSPKYSKGYVMIEKRALESLRVPNPTRLPLRLRTDMLASFAELQAAKTDAIPRLVAVLSDLGMRAFNVSQEDRRVFGL